MLGKKDLAGRIKYKLEIFAKAVIFLIIYSISGFFQKKEKYRNLWIVSERGDDAGDNGYSFFCYMRREHPEYNVKYVIKTNVPDARKVKQTGEIIPFGSMEHYLSIILAKVLVSTHVLGYTTNDYLFKKFERRGMLKGKRIFLQHGITKDDIWQLYRKETLPDLYACVLEKEADYIRKKFGHPDSVVQLTGFCRYDQLPLPGERRKKMRMILFMPTWRSDLHFYSKNDFTESSYYRNWQTLMNSPEFLLLLEKYDYRMFFYPHHQMQKFIDTFSSVSERVTIASGKDYQVQKLLIEADILVTDFSSVFFDFAYMQKPLIYFQFDEKDYREKNYRPGWFCYETDGLGKVVQQPKKVIPELENILARGCTMDTLYRERQKRLFIFHDHNNCERTFKAIEKLLISEKS